VRVILGSNEFIDCPTLLAYRGRPVLRVGLNPLRVDLDPPADLPPVALHHRVTDRSDAIITEANQPVAVATLIDAETVNLALNLRPLGMNIVADLGGIHIGRNLFVGNVIEGAPIGINLG
jgi:hypothetical protein